MSNIQLMQGDCLERMKEIPDGSVDMVLADPPYGMSFRSNYRKERYESIPNDESLFWVDFFASEVFRVAKSNTAHYVFCSFHKIDVFKQSLARFFKVKNVLIWEKNNTSMGDLKADFAPKYEMILFLQKGRRFINGRRDPNIMRFARTGNKLHPTEKPVPLIAYLLEKFSDVGSVILDPFMGSGTTGVACVRTKRNFIGIELDEKYFKIAEQRIQQEQPPI